MLRVVFYVSEAGNEPVRDWLLEQTKEVRGIIGLEITIAQHGWPMGMPLVKRLTGTDFYEFRILVKGLGKARILFVVSKDVENQECFVLLHGFIKKSAKLPREDLAVTKKRFNHYLKRGTEKGKETKSRAKNV